MEFQRETRYIVVKLTDLASAGLSQSEINAFNNFCDKIAIARASHGKPPLQCVVVESDWPEYEPTWRAIEERMTGKTISDECDLHEWCVDQSEISVKKQRSCRDCEGKGTFTSYFDAGDHFGGK